MTDIELERLELAADESIRQERCQTFETMFARSCKWLIEEVRRSRRVLQAMTISGRGGHEFRRWADDALMGKTCLVCGRFFGEAGCCGREEGRPTSADTRTAPKEPPPGSR